MQALLLYFLRNCSATSDNFMLRLIPATRGRVTLKVSSRLVPTDSYNITTCKPGNLKRILYRAGQKYLPNLDMVLPEVMGQIAVSEDMCVML